MVWEEREGGVGGEGRWCGRRVVGRSPTLAYSANTRWSGYAQLGGEGRWCGKREKGGTRKL